MSEKPNVLIAEATKVVTDSERYLEAAEELVVGIPTRRGALMERIAAAEERSRQAKEKWDRLFDEEVGKWELRETEREGTGLLESLRSSRPTRSRRPPTREPESRCASASGTGARGCQAQAERHIRTWRRPGGTKDRGRMQGRGSNINLSLHTQIRGGVELDP